MRVKRHNFFLHKTATVMLGGKGTKNLCSLLKSPFLPLVTHSLAQSVSVTSEFSDVRTVSDSCDVLVFVMILVPITNRSQIKDGNMERRTQVDKYIISWLEEEKIKLEKDVMRIFPNRFEDPSQGGDTSRGVQSVQLLLFVQHLLDLLHFLRVAVFFQTWHLSMCKNFLSTLYIGFIEKICA